MEVIQVVPQERLSDRMAEQIVKLFAAFQGNDIPERVVEQIVDRREAQVTKKTTKIPTGSANH